MRKQPEDTVFTDEEIEAVKYVLYHANAGGRAVNPPHPSWYNAACDPENRRRHKRMVKNNRI